MRGSGRRGALFRRHGEYIAEETLSREIRGERAPVDQGNELELEEDLRVWLGVRR